MIGSPSRERFPRESHGPAARVVVVDAGMGNIGSIVNMLKKAGSAATASSDPADILAAERLVLPGVGAFDQGMEKLAALGLVEPLARKVLEEKTPILGICLGMQLFTRRSEEGDRAGLGWIDAEAVRFRLDGGGAKLKVPHMGWSPVELVKESVLFRDMRSDSAFYFVHSYHVACADPSDVLATARYGGAFTAALERGNIFATQFHPEKSHRHGLRLIQNFLDLA